MTLSLGDILKAIDQLSLEEQLLVQTHVQMLIEQQEQVVSEDPEEWFQKLKDMVAEFQKDLTEEELLQLTDAMRGEKT